MKSRETTADIHEPSEIVAFLQDMRALEMTRARCRLALAEIVASRFSAGKKIDKRITPTACAALESVAPMAWSVTLSRPYDFAALQLAAWTGPDGPAPHSARISIDVPNTRTDLSGTVVTTTPGEWARDHVESPARIAAELARLEGITADELGRIAARIAAARMAAELLESERYRYDADAGHWWHPLSQYIENFRNRR